MCQAYAAEASFVSYLEEKNGRCDGGCNGITYCRCHDEFDPEYVARRLIELNGEGAREKAEELRNHRRCTGLHAPKFWNAVVEMLDSVVTLCVPTPRRGWW